MKAPTLAIPATLSAVVCGACGGSTDAETSSSGGKEGPPTVAEDAGAAAGSDAAASEFPVYFLETCEVVENPDGVAWSGRVVDAKPGELGAEQPAPGIQVRVWEREDLSCVLTDENGRFTLPGLPANERLNVLFVGRNTTAELKPIETGTSDFSYPTIVRVPTLQTAQEWAWPEGMERPVDAQTGGIAFIAVHLFSWNPLLLKGVTGVSIHLTPSEGPGAMYVETGGDLVEGATATAGGFGGFFRYLPAGDYTLRWESDSWRCQPFSAEPPHQFGYPVDERNITAPVFPVLETQAVGFICRPLGQAPLDCPASTGVALCPSGEFTLERYECDGEDVAPLLYQSAITDVRGSFELRSDGSCVFTVTRSSPTCSRLTEHTVPIFGECTEITSSFALGSVPDGCSFNPPDAPSLQINANPVFPEPAVVEIDGDVLTIRAERQGGACSGQLVEETWRRL